MVNTMGKGEYIKEHIIWWFIAYIWFRTLIFRCLPGCTHFQSFLILLAMAVVVVGLCIVLTWERERNYTNLMLHIFLSWGVFTVVAYADLFKRQMILIGIVVVIVSTFLSALILGRKIRRNGTRRLIIKRRVRTVISVWRRNSAIASLVLLIPIGTSMLFNGTVMSSTLEVAKVYGDEHSLSANMEVICNIAPERWEQLDMKERLNVCQAIVNCEARYYGLSHELMVGTAALDGNTLAYYNEQLHQIVIDVDYLKLGYSYVLLESLIHECTHAYQYEQINLYKKVDEESRNLLMFYEASVYLEEFADYVDGSDSEDFERYYGQLAEVNARKAGESGAEEYIRRIEEYLYEAEGVQGEYITIY